MNDPQRLVVAYAQRFGRNPSQESLMTVPTERLCQLLQEALESSLTVSKGASLETADVASLTSLRVTSRWDARTLTNHRTENGRQSDSAYHPIGMKYRSVVANRHYRRPTRLAAKVLKLHHSTEPCPGSRGALHRGRLHLVAIRQNPLPQPGATRRPNQRVHIQRASIRSDDRQEYGHGLTR